MMAAARRRRTGEAARAVRSPYDLPLNPEAGIGTRYNPNDGKGHIWASTPNGAGRFDPVSGKFTEYKSTAS